MPPPRVLKAAFYMGFRSEATAALAAADEHWLVFKLEFHGTFSFACELAPATSREGLRQV